MPMVTGGFAHLLEKDFKKIYFDNYMAAPSQYRDIANMSSENSHSIKEGTMSGLKAFQMLHESQATPFDEFKWNAYREKYFTEYGLGLQVSNILYEDDQTGHMKKGIAELGKAAGYTKDLRFWDVLNSGSTNLRLGFDGLPLFSAVHPLMATSGLTQSNVVNGTLSKSILETAINRFSYLQSDKGTPIIKIPKVLWIPYQQRWRAKELLMSALDPETANNTINTLYDEGITYRISRFLTDANACFLCAANNEHDLRFITRREIQFESHDDPNTRAAIFSGHMRFAATFFEWRGVVKITGV